MQYSTVPISPMVPKAPPPGLQVSLLCFLLEAHRGLFLFLYFPHAALTRTLSHEVQVGTVLLPWQAWSFPKCSHWPVGAARQRRRRIPSPWREPHRASPAPSIDTYCVGIAPSIWT
ncbi:unnamed protein product [Periconia digitata]|uniref:Uncharacterized protein n=1 Tax=Periconia digitata TaxID=1303443 RepID=A0A9W4U9N9_9PLEO|nr:unnamed protein product [Periconia digitata]